MQRVPRLDSTFDQPEAQAAVRTAGSTRSERSTALSILNLAATIASSLVNTFAVLGTQGPNRGVHSSVTFITTASSLTI
jgi:hypothetical protein